MSTILAWSIMWLISLACFAKMFGKVTTGDVLFTLVSAPGAVLIGLIMLLVKTTEGKFNKTLWKK